jgi:hypothetical protein
VLSWRRRQVEAEAADDLSEKFDISVVPTFIFLHVRGASVVASRGAHHHHHYCAVVVACVPAASA